MVSVPLGITAFKRDHTRGPEVRVTNRYYEKNPFNQAEQVALIIRPGVHARTTVGAGPIRAMKYQSGVFLNDMFVVSGVDFFRVHKAPNVADVVTQIVGTVDGNPDEQPDIAITDEYVFIADGNNLLYTDGVAALAPITVPDGLGIASIDVIAGYVICVAAQSDKFFWVEPGGITIDPLNFATAERLPDWVTNVRAVGDQFWLLGQKTNEVWYLSGDPLSPMQRAQGRTFDQGVWGGTAVRVNDVVMVVGNDGVVMKIAGGPQPVSTPGITERIRKAIKIQDYLG